MKIIYDLIIPIIAITIFSIIASKSIKKYSKVYYGVACLIVVVSSTYEVHKIIVHGEKLTGILYKLERVSLKGFMALAFFILVMFCGAMNKKWSVTKRLLSIRGELSIIGAILMIPHVIVYVTKFIMKLIEGKEISAYNYIYVVFGVAAILILIPLFITSVKGIKSRMQYIKWKSIQKWSYLFFALIYLHVVIILVNKDEFDILKFILYSAIFIGYSVLKISKTKVVAK